MSSYTPLPWRLEYDRIVGSESVHSCGHLRNELGISSASFTDEVCKLTGQLGNTQPLGANTADDNAALIIEAVNGREALLSEIRALREENAVLRSQVENADINLEQVRMAQKAMWRTKLDSAESEIARLTKELEAAQKYIDLVSRAGYV